MNKEELMMKVAETMVALEPTITMESALAAIGELSPMDIHTLLKAYEEKGEEEMMEVAKEAHENVYGRPKFAHIETEEDL